MKLLIQIFIGVICVFQTSFVCAESKISLQFCSLDFEKKIIEAKKLKFRNSKDRLRGEELTLKLVDQFQIKLKKSNKNMKFNTDWEKCFRLVREVAIFDSESQIAQILSEKILTDNDIKLSYEQFILNEPPLSDSELLCKHRYLKSVVSEQLCFEKNKITAEDSAKDSVFNKTERCIERTDFSKCLGQ